MPQPDDFLVKRENQKPADEAVFTWFGPVDSQQRFRFLVLKEAGDLVSVLPGAEAKFKTGLMALRWSDAKEGTSTSYIVLKTKPNRIDLRKIG